MWQLIKKSHLVFLSLGLPWKDEKYFSLLFSRGKVKMWWFSKVFGRQKTQLSGRRRVLRKWEWLDFRRNWISWAQKEERTRQESVSINGEDPCPLPNNRSEWFRPPQGCQQGYVVSEVVKVWTSPVAQWLRICLPLQGTQVPALVREVLTCRRATKPLRHNYWACALEPASHNYWSPRA